MNQTYTYNSLYKICVMERRPFLIPCWIFSSRKSIFGVLGFWFERVWKKGEERIYDKNWFYFYTENDGKQNVPQLYNSFYIIP